METEDRKIRLNSSTYTVEFMDKIPVRRGFRWGETDTVEKTIKVATKKASGRKMTNDEKKLTYFHELVHAILDEGQYCKESNNETLVEWIGHCLLQLSKQKAL